MDRERMAGAREANDALFMPLEKWLRTLKRGDAFTYEQCAAKIRGPLTAPLRTRIRRLFNETLRLTIRALDGGGGWRVLSAQEQANQEMGRRARAAAREVKAGLRAGAGVHEGELETQGERDALARRMARMALANEAVQAARKEPELKGGQERPRLSAVKETK